MCLAICAPCWIVACDLKFLKFWLPLLSKLATSAAVSRLYTDVSAVNYLTQSAVTSINNGRCFKTYGQAPWEAAGSESS